MKTLLLLLTFYTFVFAQTYQEFAQQNSYELDYKVAVAKSEVSKQRVDAFACDKLLSLV